MTTAIEIFEQNVAQLGGDAELARQLMDQAEFDPSVKASVRADISLLGGDFSLRQAAGALSGLVGPGVPMDTALYGLCALVFTVCVQTHDYHFAPDGGLWFRSRRI